MTAAPTPEPTAIGFVTPPRWISPSTIEFPAVVAGRVVPQQTFVDLPGFGYSLAEVATATSAVERAGALLGEAGCAAIGMEGTPFAWAGCDDEAAARSRVGAFAAAAGVPATMAGTAIVDALRGLGATRVALCPTYYPTEWRDAWRSFVAACGFEVVYCRTMADEGITGPIDGVDTVGWHTGADLVTASVVRAAEHSDGLEADAIVVTGAGCRTTGIVHHLERLAGRPVVGADSALFWALVGLADLPLRPDSLGALTLAGQP